MPFVGVREGIDHIIFVLVTCAAAKLGDGTKLNHRVGHGRSRKDKAAHTRHGGSNPMSAGSVSGAVPRKVLTYSTGRFWASMRKALAKRNGSKIRSFGVLKVFSSVELRQYCRNMVCTVGFCWEFMLQPISSSSLRNRRPGYFCCTLKCYNCRRQTFT